MIHDDEARAAAELAAGIAVAAGARSKARLGPAGYARLLKALETPCTRTELMQRADVGRNAASRFLDGAHRFQRVRICDWHFAPRLFPEPVWIAESGEDCPIPATRPNGRPFRPPRARERAPVKTELLTFFLALEMLDAGTTRDELKHAFGIHWRTQKNLIAALRSVGLARTIGWRRRADGMGPWIEVFGFGPGPNRKRPAPKSRTQRNHDHRARRAVRLAGSSVFRMCAPNASVFHQSA